MSLSSRLETGPSIHFYTFRSMLFLSEKMVISKVLPSKALEIIDVNSYLVEGVSSNREIADYIIDNVGKVKIRRKDFVDDIRFCMYFDFSKRQLYVTGCPDAMILAFNNISFILPVFDDFYPEHALLFSDIPAPTLKELYRELEDVMSKKFGWEEVSSELERNLLVGRSEIRNMLDDNGRMAAHQFGYSQIFLDENPFEKMFRHLDHLRARIHSWNRRRSDESTRAPENRWKKRSSRKI